MAMCTALGGVGTVRNDLAPLAILGTASLAPALFAGTGALAARRIIAGRLAFRSLKLELGRLNLATGVRSMLSRDAVLNGAKALLCAAAVALALVPILAGTFAQGARGGSPESLGALALRGVASVLAIALAIGFALAVADAGLESAKWRRRLRMSFEELKRDLRQSEGDPLLRMRRRRAHGGLAHGAIERVPEAAFVVANPTHIAIALAYRPPEIAVPRVVVRAVDHAALVVKRRANELGIPIVEDVALARALLATTEPGAFIPRDLYETVARIVASLLHQHRLSV
jgi:flagellar biosynthetic protein FlhB